MLAVTVNPQVKNSLKLEELPIPEIGKGEVRVKIVSAALNHRDLYVNNEWRAMKESGLTKLVAGGDGVGIIDELGEGVEGWSIGDEILLNPYDMVRDRFLGGPNDGTIAEFITVPSDTLLKKPSYLTFEEAAGVPLALSTAWGTVVTKGDIQKDETVLIQGIGGGVALFILQLALERGARVLVTSGSDEKIEKAIELGAMTGFNYRKENIAEKVMEFTEGKGVDVVIDSSGKDSIESSVNSLSSEGRLLVFGSTTGGFDWSQLKEQNLIETGMVNQTELEDALEYYTQRRLRPILSQQVYNLNQYKEAYAELEEAKQFGKIIINVQ